MMGLLSGGESVSPTEAAFDEYSAAYNYRDIIIDYSGLTFLGITGLTNGEAYTSSSTQIVLNKEFLATLNIGDHVFTLEFDGEKTDDITVHITE